MFDPACGSGGMFVQSSHFIEHEGGDTAMKVMFYGQEKNRDTIGIAKMKLAVHRLEGKIAEVITYYQDDHNLAGRKAMDPGKCDFVMANPPLNVDLVVADRIKGDPILPFGLPGVNKSKKVSKGNCLWISYFWSYLSGKGRAGCPTVLCHLVERLLDGRFLRLKADGKGENQDNAEQESAVAIHIRSQRLRLSKVELKFLGYTQFRVEEPRFQGNCTALRVARRFDSGKRRSNFSRVIWRKSWPSAEFGGISHENAFKQGKLSKKAKISLAWGSGHG